MPLLSPFWTSLRRPPAKSVRIAFPDASDPRVKDASRFLESQKLLTPVLVEKPAETDRERFRVLLQERQKKLNLEPSEISKQLEDSLYHAVCLLLEGAVDGIVGGSLRPTADVVKAALRCIGPKAGSRLVSGQFLIESENVQTTDQTPFLFADCAVVPEPSPRALSLAALSAADSYRFFTGKVPKVAFLSFSTKGSAEHALVDRIKEALEITRKQDANLLVDGEMQVDAVMSKDVAAIKGASDSPIAGSANVFIFPTLEAGNIGYKLVQRFSKARIAGPILWGLDKPVSDLSRGCSTDEIIDSALCVAKMIAERS